MPKHPPIATAIKREHSGLRLAGSWAAIFVGTVALLVGPALASVAYELIVDGGLAMLWLLAAAGVGITIFRIPAESKPLTFATAAALGLGVMSLATLGLGLAGWMRQPVAVAMLAAGLVAGTIRWIPALKATKVLFRPANWMWLLLAPLAAIATVATLVPAGFLWGDEPHGYDVLEYHLQVPREWFELGRIVPLHHNVFSHFPFNVEMHYLLAMHLRGGPWAGMYLAQFMHLAMVALTVVAIAGVTRPAVALLVAAVPWMTLLGTICYNEGGLLLFGTLSIIWVLRAHGRIMSIVLAGAMAGFACGAKLTAVPMLLLPLPLVAVLCKTHWKHAAMFAASGMVCFAPWLIRTGAWAGNPLFPEALSLGRAHFSPEQAERFELAHGPTPAQAGLLPKLEALWTQVLADWRYGWLLVPLGVAAAFYKADRHSLLLASMLALLLLFWLGFTHLQGRFLVLVIPVSAMLAARLPVQALVPVCVLGTVLGIALTALKWRDVSADFAQRTGGIELSATLGAPEFDQTRAPPLDDIDDAATLVLVGDARAYLYQRPMSRLQYRTVFDVRVTNDDVIASWIGRPLTSDDVVLVDPGELRRFSRTYLGIPAPPTDRDQRYLLRR